MTSHLPLVRTRTDHGSEFENSQLLKFCEDWNHHVNIDDFAASTEMALDEDGLYLLFLRENLQLPRERVVQKLLISLPRSYDSICSVIEHSKDLDTLEIQEVVASLKNFELRLDRHAENSTEKAFTSLNIESKSSKNGSSSGGNKSQKNWKENGKNWNNKSNSNSKPNASSEGTKTPFKHCEKMHYGKCWFEGKPKCRGCGKFGHMVKNCHDNQPVQKVNYANQVEETGTLFFACNAVTDVKLNNSWYVDSGCSNHMTGDERLLIDI
ncbi:hypothetical protein L3X38_009496 [Prunus dulcis]|uniref:CCHC-type domain-containing protein n=1 Tax=Prunus dulcis TaxID=3755 RepID=A0AAD4WEF6_PRUDU|nr:hypothetical protein L3X38_009496 [Prunus dulcis]